MVTPAFAFMIFYLPFFLLATMTGLTIVKTPVTGLMVAYLMVSLVTIPLVENVRSSLIGWGASGLMFAGYLYTVAYLDTHEKLDRAIICFIAIGTIVAIMGLIEFAGFVFFQEKFQPPFSFKEPQGGSYGFGGGLMRMHGFFVSSNKVGSYLLIPFGMAMFKAFSGKAIQKSYAFLALFLGGVILLSLARNAQVGLIVVLTSLVILIPRRNIYREGLLVFAGMILLIILIMINPTTHIALVDRINPFTQNMNVSGADYDLRLFKEHLVTAGIAGTHNFGLGRGLQNYDDWAFDTGRVVEWGAHSNFLKFLGETGFVGLAFQLLIVIHLVKDTIMEPRGFSSEKILPRFLLSIFLGMVFTGVIRTYYYTEYVWVLIGLLVRSIQISRKKIIASPAPNC